jgi:hypothetical protein
MAIFVPKWLQAAVIVSFGALALGSAAEAGWTTGVLISEPGYDYAPSVMLDGSVYKFWWLGQGSSSDVINYKTYNSGTNTWSATSTVITPGASPRLDTNEVGDPTVVKGSFVDPDNSNTYSYIMYYDSDVGCGGTNIPYDSRIFAAYSNDGVTWTKYNGSSGNGQVLGSKYNACYTYGTGQPAAYNSSSTGSTITLLYVDTSTDGAAGSAGCTPPGGGSGCPLSASGTCVNCQPEIFEVTSTDGIHFSSPTRVTTRGLTSTDTTDGVDYAFGADFAYDSTASAWQSVYMNRQRTGNLAEMQVGLYSIGASNLTNTSSGTWSEEGVVDSSLTGYPSNNNAGLLRMPYGGAVYPLQIFFASGSATDATTWDISTATLTTSPTTTLSLQRYFNGTDVLTTTGYVPAGYSLNIGNSGTPTTGLGYLFQSPQTGTVELFQCIYANPYGYNDYYLSVIGPTSHLAVKQNNCDGNTSVTFDGTAGWVYSASNSQPANTIAIYQCLAPIPPSNAWEDLYVSRDPNCERTPGAYPGNLLGYTKNSP